MVSTIACKLVGVDKLVTVRGNGVAGGPASGGCNAFEGELFIGSSVPFSGFME